MVRKIYSLELENHCNVAFTRNLHTRVSKSAWAEFSQRSCKICVMWIAFTRKGKYGFNKQVDKRARDVTCHYPGIFTAILISENRVLFCSAGSNVNNLVQSSG